MSKFEVGDKVISYSYGIGEVVDVNFKEVNSAIYVSFESGAHFSFTSDGKIKTYCINQDLYLYSEAPEWLLRQVPQVLEFTMTGQNSQCSPSELVDEIVDEFQRLLLDFEKEYNDLKWDITFKLTFKN